VCVHASEAGDYRRTIFSGGLIEYTILEWEQRQEDFVIDPSQVMAVAGNVLLAAERFRRAAGAPDVEYGLEVEIRTRGRELQISGYDRRERHHTLGALSTPAELFPRYVVGPREEFGKVWSMIERDFWNAAGKDWGESPLSLDFERAFRELGLTPDAAGLA
jgi:hypothetical protein